MLEGRVVSDLSVVADKLVLRFADTSELVVSRTDHGVSVMLHETVDGQTPDLKGRPTPRQRDYLDFIRSYMARFGVSPAETDIRDHFMVSAPSAHEMVKTLERRGFISRDRDFVGNVIPRSIRVLID